MTKDVAMGIGGYLFIGVCTLLNVGSAIWNVFIIIKRKREMKRIGNTLYGKMATYVVHYCGCVGGIVKQVNAFQEIGQCYACKAETRGGTYKIS